MKRDVLYGLPGFQPATGDTGGARGELRAAILTTFEPPDPVLLVEDLLPDWLDMERSHTDEGGGRAAFLVDLQSRLRRLRGRVAIFCSPRLEASPGASHWLWRDLLLLPVGARERAVQHAKLWMFHRGPADESEDETLEIVVSSTNLTRSALREQVQAGWRALIRLGAETKVNKKSWGVLPSFLMELGRQAGPQGSEFVGYWGDILARGSCPSDASFVASVPGRHSFASMRGHDQVWGTAGLRSVRPTSPRREIDILAPTVGAFDAAGLRSWADDTGASVGALRVAWLAKDGPGGAPHSWAPHWSMPPATRKTLEKARVHLREFPRKPLKFHGDWDDNDPRWLHAKLYWIRDGRRLRVLIGSANWSQAAWGRRQGNRLIIENFELGVVVNTDWRPLDRLANLLPRDAVTSIAAVHRKEGALAWAQASWDGKRIAVETRLGSSAATLPSSIVVVSHPARRTPHATRWTTGSRGNRSTRLRWRSHKKPPLAVLLHVAGPQGGDYAVPIADLRPGRSLVSEALDGLTDEAAAALELALLEERYGGPWANDSSTLHIAPADASKDADRPDDSQDLEPGADDEELAIEDLTTAWGGPLSDYQIEAVRIARDRLHIVSAWADEVSKAWAIGGTAPQPIVDDGCRLASLWERRLQAMSPAEKVSTAVAVDELRARLRGLKA